MHTKNMKSNHIYIFWYRYSLIEVLSSNSINLSSTFWPSHLSCTYHQTKNISATKISHYYDNSTTTTTSSIVIGIKRTFLYDSYSSRAARVTAGYVKSEWWWLTNQQEIALWWWLLLIRISILNVRKVIYRIKRMYVL